MMLGMAAASSAIDLIKTLTKSGSSKTTAGTGFSAATSTSSSSASSGASGAPSSLLAPDTLNALFAAQGQSDPSSTSATSKSDALKDLFKTLDGDGDGKITKTEFENALGAGGTNTANADSVFDKLDKNGDGSVSLGELSSALKGGGKHHAHGSKGGGGAGGGEDALMQALDGTSGSTTTNSDGSITTSLTYADGSTVTMVQPAAASASSSATQSYNAIEQMIQRQVDMLTRTASASSSLSVSV